MAYRRRTPALAGTHHLGIPGHGGGRIRVALAALSFAQRVERPAKRVVAAAQPSGAPPPVAMPGKHRIGGVQLPRNESEREVFSSPRGSQGEEKGSRAGIDWGWRPGQLRPPPPHVRSMSHTAHFCRNLCLFVCLCSAHHSIFALPILNDSLHRPRCTVGLGLGLGRRRVTRRHLPGSPGNKRATREGARHS